jgi:uncharacterized lipoprotein YmbA
MRKKLLIAAALLVACSTAVVQAHAYIEAEKRLYPKSANPDGTLNCAPGCLNPVTLCC